MYVNKASCNATCDRWMNNFIRVLTVLQNMMVNLRRFIKSLYRLVNFKKYILDLHIFAYNCISNVEIVESILQKSEVDPANSFCDITVFV